MEVEHPVGVLGQGLDLVDLERVDASASGATDRHGLRSPRSARRPRPRGGPRPRRSRTCRRRGPRRAVRRLLRLAGSRVIGARSDCASAASDASVARAPRGSGRRQAPAVGVAVPAAPSRLRRRGGRSSRWPGSRRASGRARAAGWRPRPARDAPGRRGRAAPPRAHGPAACARCARRPPPRGGGRPPRPGRPAAAAPSAVRSTTSSWPEARAWSRVRRGAISAASRARRTRCTSGRSTRDCGVGLEDRVERLGRRRRWRARRSRRRGRRSGSPPRRGRRGRGRSTSRPRRRRTRGRSGR